MGFTFASWNINSVRQREGLVLDWLGRHTPDLLCLQEIKCEEHQFPASFAEHGWHVAIAGQKAYNGVAILARAPFEITHRRLPGFDHESARYIEVETAGLRLGNLYLPNGNSGGEAGYATKLDFFAALHAHARAALDEGRDFALAGDYNVCPDAVDCAPGALSPDDALLRPESRAAWRRLCWLGLTDALRAVQPAGKAYTFWDYQAGAWDRDCGLRIDHALLSPRLADRLQGVRIDAPARALPQPSDHVPLIVTLDA
ncbi:exodeoxyribonuclease III [Acidomonas methanolica]|uniref:exodeoxyribonuclease III n=1 Tax=Acidomonas methanolica TaxID=437 RepID=UPI00211A1CEF|nr:exodeoxyribonuclease III [Acidomonas methanolica]MCQ9155031.1 exodeoxyribonuclease III [Acidomonas methanolica]